jgi:hypothetical protein
VRLATSERASCLRPDRLIACNFDATFYAVWGC